MNTPEDAELVIFVVTGSFLFLVFSGFLIFFIFLYRQRQLSFQRKEAQIQAEFKQTLLEADLEIREETLRMVSRELHDNFGHIASLIKIHLTMMPKGNDSKADQLTASSLEMIKQLISDLKDLSLSLNKSYITEVGIEKALESEAEKVRKVGIEDCNIIISGEPLRIPDEKMIILYRICQEIIQNTLKHSKSNSLSISLTYHSNALQMEFKDKGVGFSVQETRQNALKNKSSGLRNLVDRAEMIGANLTLTSEHGIGTTTKILLPLEVL